MKMLLALAAVLLSSDLASAGSSYPNFASIIQSASSFNAGIAVQQGQISQTTPSQNWGFISQYASGISNNSIIIQGATITQSGPMGGY
jgi:hypothetical protein